jgi:hypothetical protein
MITFVQETPGGGAKRMMSNVQESFFLSIFFMNFELLTD